MRPLDGSVVLVTGGSRGIGEAIVETLHAAGATVALGDIRSEGAARVIARLGAGIQYHPLDVTKEGDWARVVRSVLAEYGRIDVLVNNAGIGGMGPIGSYPTEQYDRMIAVNQTGVFFGMRAVAPRMTETGRGSIVNIASIEGIQGMANFVSYCGSKHAVVGMSRAAALELAPYGVRVNCVCPGPIATPGLQKGMGGETMIAQLARRVPMGRMGEPSEVARAVQFLASEDSSYCTGSEIVVDGGWTAGTTVRSGDRGCLETDRPRTSVGE